MAYELRHTAKAIDHKLSLIDENKNLLEYPYGKGIINWSLPTGLEDVGDGSILTSATTGKPDYIQLNTCLLPANKSYIISLNITDLIDEQVVTNHEFKLEVEIPEKAELIIIDKDNPFAIISPSSKELKAIVYLNIPATFEADLVIKPQIEEAKVLDNGELQNSPSNWVPYMGTVGNYVDERFNSTNAKIKVLANMLKNYTPSSSTSKGELANGTDFDSVTDSGYYFIHAGNKHNNCPTNKGGLLIVYHDALNQQLKSRLYQIMIEGVTNVCLIRSRLVSGVFTSWTNYSGGVLADGTDLDTLIKPGVYWLTSSATYINAPGSQAGILHVYDDTTSSVPTRLYQQFIDGNSLETYTRVRRYGSADKNEAWLVGTGLHCGGLDGNATKLKTWDNLVDENPTVISYNINESTADISVVYNNSILKCAEEEQCSKLILALPDFIGSKYLPEFSNVENYTLTINNDIDKNIGSVVFNPTNCSSIELPTSNPPILFFKGSISKARSIKVKDSAYDLYNYAINNKITLNAYDGFITNGLVTIHTQFSSWEKLLTSTEAQAYAHVNDVMLSEVYLEQTPYTNLWNGVWTTGVRLNGDLDGDLVEDKDGLKIQVNQDFVSTAIIPVKGNTIYSCVLEHTETEPYYEYASKGNYYYFKIATATKKLANGEYFGAKQYQWMSSSTAVKAHTFKTPADAKYVYIQTSRALQIPFTLVEGISTTYSAQLLLSKINDRINPDDTTNDINILRNTYETIGEVTDTNTLYGDFEVETICKEHRTDYFDSLINKGWLTELSYDSITRENVWLGGSGSYTIVNKGDTYAGSTYKIPIEIAKNYCILVSNQIYNLSKDSQRFKCSIVDGNNVIASFGLDQTNKIDNIIVEMPGSDQSFKDNLLASFQYAENTSNAASKRKSEQKTISTPSSNPTASDESKYYLYLDICSDSLVDIRVFEYHVDLVKTQYITDYNFKYTPVKTTKNLFDGHYYDGFDLNNNTIRKYNATNLKSSTAIIPIKPGRTYTIFCGPKGQERSTDGKFYHFFRIGASKEFLSVSTIKDTELPYFVDIDKNNEGLSHTKKYTFKNTDYEYLYIMTAATSCPLLQVVEGDAEGNEDPIAKRMAEIGIEGYGEDGTTTGLSVYKIMDINPRSTGKLVEKIIVKDGRSIHTFICDSSTSDNLNKTWRWYNDKIDGNVLYDITDDMNNKNVTKTLWNRTDCEGPVRRKDDEDFTGGFHGDEYYSQLDSYTSSDVTYTVPACDLYIDGQLYKAGDSIIKHNCQDVELHVVTDVHYQTYIHKYDSKYKTETNGNPDWTDTTYIIGKKDSTTNELITESWISIENNTNSTELDYNTYNDFEKLVGGGYELYSTSTSVKDSKSYVPNTFELYRVVDDSTKELIDTDLTLSDIYRIAKDATRNELSMTDNTNTKIVCNDNYSLFICRTTKLHEEKDKNKDYTTIPKYNKDSARVQPIQSLQLISNKYTNSKGIEHLRTCINITFETKLNNEVVETYTAYDYAGSHQITTSTSITGLMYDTGTFYYYYDPEGTDYIYKYLYTDPSKLWFTSETIPFKDSIALPVKYKRLNADGTYSFVGANNLKPGDNIIFTTGLKTITSISSKVAGAVKIRGNDAAIQNCYTMELIPSQIAFKRYKNISFTPGKIRVRNTWQYVGNKDYELNISAMCGIYSIWREKLNGAKDNFHGALLPVPADRSKNLTAMDSRFQGKYVDEVTMFGKDDFTVKIRSLIKKGNHYTGHISKMQSERYKAYLWDIDLENGGKRRK